MAKRKAGWSKTIEEHGVRVRLYQRPNGVIYRAVVTGRTVSENGKDRPVEDRRSLGHRDRTKAEKQAKALAYAIAEARFTGNSAASALTMGQLFALYRRHKLPALKPARAREARSRIAMFLEAWGREFPALDVDQTRVDDYVAKRRALEVVSPGLKPDEDGKRRRGYRTPKPIRDGALHGELSWLSTVFNWARGFKVEGKRLLTENPLHGVDWPKEKNPRRPVASHQRFVATNEHVDTVDPKGRLRCILALARWTGRRESAICQLRASDLLLSEARIRTGLAAAGMDEGLAAHMPHGAVRWPAESDKEGFLFISPISRPARAALDAYLAQHPDVDGAQAAGRNVPLFPAPGRRRKKSAPPAPVETKKPIRREQAAKWLLKAEALAKQPKLRGGVFHPYRRLWAIERKPFADTDVAAAGGWKDTRALRQSYLQPDPETVLQVVEHGG